MSILEVLEYEYLSPFYKSTLVRVMRTLELLEYE